MLDSIFYYMALDGYSEWSIHARLCSSAGNMEASIPHYFCDGRRLLRHIPKSLITLGSQHRNRLQSPFDNNQSATKSVITKHTNKTWFQSVLQSLIKGQELKDNDLIAIAVDVSSQLKGDSELANQVACPLFKKSELLELCSLNKIDWIKAINDRALIEFQNYVRIGSLLPKMVKEKRILLYEKIPLHSASVIISYFGNIESFIEDVSAADLKALDFGASSTRGPRKTILGYSIGEQSFFRSSDEGQAFNWNSPTFVFTRDISIGGSEC